MEGPLEIKSSAPTTDEPIKSEEAIRSPDNGDRSEGAASPPPNCSICLGKLINTSFTDSCLHQFCFTCLLQWSKIKTECPLCKQTFKSIIHNVRSEEDYDQYHVPRELTSQIPQSPVVTMFDFEEDMNQDLGLPRDLGVGRDHPIIRRIFYRAMIRRARRQQLPSYQPQVSREESRRRREHPEDYRRMVYRLGVWSSALPDFFGQFRECSAEYYRRQPRELDRLIPWLNRELQVLLNNDAPHIAYVLRVIMDGLVQYDIRSPQFRDLVRPYFGIHTEHFVHELLNYARTNFDLVGYDQSVTYLPQGLSNEYVSRVISPTSSSSTSSDDSDIRVLGEAIDLRVNAELPSVGPHPIDMPGPSTVGQALQIEMPNTMEPDVLTISSNTSSSDDECEIVGYVKPRHARTPELIELLSSDSEEANTSNAPLWSNNTMQVLQLTQDLDVDDSASSAWHRTPSSQVVVKQSNARTNHDTSWIKTCSKTSDATSSSETTDSDSDSDYSPRRNGRYRTKSSKKSSGARKRSNASKNREREQGKRNGRRSRRMRKRSSSSSDLSYRDSTTKQMNEAKTRKGRCLTRGNRRIRDDSVEDQETRNRYAKKTDTEDDSSSSSLSDTDESSKSKRRARKSKYSSASSDTNEDRPGRVSSEEKTSRTRSRNGTRNGKNESSTSKENHESKEDRRYARSTNNRSLSRSSSEEKSYFVRRETKSSHIKRESPTDTSEYGSHDENNSISKNLRDSKRRNYGSKARIESDSTSDSDRRDFDSSSRRSEKSHNRRKKSKRKDKYKKKEKEKSRKRSSGKNSEYESYQYSTSGSSTASSTKDSHRSSRRSNYKNDSSYRDRHETSKKHRRRSQSDSNLRCKKRKRIRRSSSSSQ